MKAQILKIAGVKTEKEFYKKYPSEEAFMKQHGKAFKKAQIGGAFPKPQANTDYYDPSLESGLQYQQYTPSQESIVKENQQITEDSLGGAAEKSGGLDASAIVGMAGAVGNVFNAFASQKKQKKALQQQNKLLGLTETLSKSTDVNEPYQKHVNDRPENYMASTNSFYPAKGTGYDILRATRDGGYIKAQNGIEDRPGSMMGREQMIPEEGAEMPVQEKPSNFDSKSARDNWVQKTGLPWSEAKRLGYTSGSAKDNTKLLSELNDPRFKKENLRTSPSRSSSESRTPVQHRETPSGRLAPIKPQSYAEAMKGKPKYSGNQGNIGVPDEGNMITRLGERLANPLQTFGEYSKYGELPSEGFSKNKKNAYDQGIGMVNPAYWANAIGNASDYASEGEYTKAALEAAEALPALGKLKYTKYLPYQKGLPEAREFVRRAGYLGEGAKRLGAAPAKQLAGKAAKQIAPSYVPNFTMYQSGGPIGGNPTEIQNTYDPYDIYSDGGSDNVKSYQEGGGFGNAISGQVSGLIGQGFNNNAGFQAGEALGGVSDLIFPGSGVFTRPLLGLAGGIADQAFGDAGDINRLTQQNQGTQNRIMDNSAWKGIKRDTAVSRDGGYLNPEYNPQVITMFGDHNAEDFADYAHKYRAGGHLKEYTAPSERAMETYADGGEVTSRNLGETQVESGGYLKPISYNPHNDGTGWTSKIEGQYHSDYDPKLGHSGVIFNHGNNQVEAERGELIRHVQEGDSVDGKEGELSANITGNLVYEPIFGDEDSKYKKYEKMKIKNIHEDIANQDARLNKKEFQINDKISNLNSEGNDSYSKLKQTSLDMMKKGIDQQYAVNAEAADYFTNHQTKVNDLVDQMSNLHGKEFSHEKFAKKGILSDVLAKGEISQAARNGKTLYKAQAGTYATKGVLPGSIDYNAPDVAGDIFKGTNYKTQWGPKRDAAFSNPDVAKKLISDLENYSGQDAEDVKAVLAKQKTMSGKIAKAYELASDEKVGPYHTILNSIIDKNATSPAVTPLPATTTKPAATTELEPIEETKKGAPWLSAATSLIRGFQPAFNMPLGNQINPELYALANNRVKGFSPEHEYDMLKNPYKYSADKDRNAILSQARQAVKNAGNNPAAQAAIMAQVADSIGQVSSKEYDINQQTYQGVYNDNIGTVNQNRNRNAALDMDAQLKMLQAESNTDARTLSALTSLYGKEAANKKMNFDLNMQQSGEYPDYTLNSSGQFIKLPRFVDFDTSGKGVATSSKQSAPEGFEYLYDANGKIKSMKSKKEDTARNGKSIKTKNANSNVVRAFKGF